MLNEPNGAKRATQQAIVEHFTGQKQWTNDLQNFITIIIRKDRDYLNFLGHSLAFAARLPDLAVTCLRNFPVKYLLKVYLGFCGCMQGVEEEHRQNYLIKALSALKLKVSEYIKTMSDSAFHDKLLQDTNNALREFFRDNKIKGNVTRVSP